jgi:hypothetical protein
MSLQAEANAAGVPVHHVWVRIVLIAVAVVESFGLFSAILVFSGDLSEVPGGGLGGWIVGLTLLLRPLLAITALVLAMRGRLPQSIMVLGAAVLMRWLNMVPFAVLNGLEFDGSGAIYASAHFLLSPVPAVAAMLLAWKDRQRLALPAVLVSLPTFVEWLGVAAFAIGVAIYGF